MELIPIDMDVPQTRRDISQIQNVAWMLRNLGIRHQDHPEFANTINMLKQKLKELRNA